MKRLFSRYGKMPCRVLQGVGIVIGVYWFGWWFLVPCTITEIGSGLAVEYDYWKRDQEP